MPTFKSCSGETVARIGIGLLQFRSQFEFLAWFGILDGELIRLRHTGNAYPEFRVFTTRIESMLRSANGVFNSLNT